MPNSTTPAEREALRFFAALPCFVRDPGGQHWPMTSLSAARRVEEERDSALAEIARLRAALKEIASAPAGGKWDAEGHSNCVEIAREALEHGC